MEYNFLTQLVGVPTMRDEWLDLLFTSRGLVDDVVLGVLLGQRDHKMIEFSIPGVVREKVRKTSTLDFRRADFGLFRTLIGRIPWETLLEDTGVQEGWTHQT